MSVPAVPPRQRLGAGDVVAALPYYAGYQPTPGCIGYFIVSEAGELRRVGVLPPAVTPGLAPRAARAVIEPALRQDSDGVILLAYGQEASATAKALTAALINRLPWIANTAITVDLQQDRYRVGGPGQAIWQDTPPPPVWAIATGQPAPAANLDELVERYAPLNGPGQGVHATRIMSGDRKRLDSMSPSLRRDVALRTIDGMAGREGARDLSASRLAHIARSAVVRDSLLRESYSRPERVEALVQATRIAHPDDVDPLVGLTAAALYAAGHHVSVVFEIAERATGDSLSATIRAAALNSIPPNEIRALLEADTYRSQLRQADSRWLERHTRPDAPKFPERLGEARGKLRRPEDPTDRPYDPPQLPPSNVNGPNL
ncbi:hypothetical protein OCAE111667_26770 [Occultella aeris]|uniref:DUF4192 domain-containing protein n=1 Tax=Occultella aeris TaxID=2761496 RepID=A0A7M4DJS3_9MICO|nr:hypothetical protein [Occultella aeris]VZO37307.1 hypothetical protein HALOF300_02381 [Occultella aeris]